MRLPSLALLVSDRSVTLVAIPEMSVLFEYVISSQLVAMLIGRRESLVCNASNRLVGTTGLLIANSIE